MNPPDPAPGRYVAISVGGRHACALTEAGEAVCWDAVDNKLAPPDPPPGRYVAVSDGSHHTCALTEDGEAACLGVEQLRTGGCAAGPLHRDQCGCVPHLRHHRVGRVGVLGRGLQRRQPPPGSLAAISAGYYSACALTVDGEVACPAGGDLARDAPAGRHTAISVASGHACALAESGEAVCWGDSAISRGTPPGRYTSDQRPIGARVRAHHRRGGAVLERVRVQERPSTRSLRRGNRGRRSHLRTHRGRRGGVLGPRPRLVRLRPDRSPARPLRGDQRGLGPHLRRHPRGRRSSAGATRTTSCGRSHRCNVPPPPSRALAGAIGRRRALVVRCAAAIAGAL